MTRAGAHRAAPQPHLHCCRLHRRWRKPQAAVTALGRRHQRRPQAHGTLQGRLAAALPPASRGRSQSHRRRATRLPTQPRQGALLPLPGRRAPRQRPQPQRPRRAGPSDSAAPSLRQIAPPRTSRAPNRTRRLTASPRNPQPRPPARLHPRATSAHLLQALCWCRPPPRLQHPRRLAAVRTLRARHAPPLRYRSRPCHGPPR
mmetsp:Transcript_14670/g.47959  ORF Transcript_14670/g.47959 Transcript_14670/m.47959 type:complete len:202 (-) Transcript_14670:1235-1840(-)